MAESSEILMDQDENSDKPSTSSGGRPLHEHWFGYWKVYINGRLAPKCKNCKKTFKSTERKRMANHRYEFIYVFFKIFQLFSLCIRTKMSSLTVAHCPYSVLHAVRQTLKMIQLKILIWKMSNL